MTVSKTVVPGSNPGRPAKLVATIPTLFILFDERKTINKEKGVCEISSIMVDKNYRKQGFGKKF
jgi:ribosomal protein S18 acetylase RimI-like enzyme